MHLQYFHHLNSSLHEVLDEVAPATRRRIHVAYIEKVLFFLAKRDILTGGLRGYATWMHEKYIVRS